MTKKWEEQFDEKFVQKGTRTLCTPRASDYIVGYPKEIKAFISQQREEAFNEGMRKANSGRQMYQQGLKDGRKEALEELKSGEMCVCDCCGEFKKHSMMGACEECI